jgi:hypothetical protein
MFTGRSSRCGNGSEETDSVAERTEQLIERLAAEVRPVHRLRPPLYRGGLWLLAVAVLTGGAIAAFADWYVFAERARDPRLVVEMVGTLAAGIAAIVAAFELSLPDRSRRWLLLPLPPLMLWLASSGYGCYRQWLIVGPSGWELGESAHCLRFILGVSLPLGVSLLITLRRAMPLSPLPVGAAGGLGVGALAAFSLQFFHPFDVTVTDLAVHAVAVAIVVSLATAAQRLAAREGLAPSS